MTLNKSLLLIAFLLLKTADASAQFTLSIREEQITKEINTLWNINLAYIGTKETEELQVKLSLLNSNDKIIYEVLSPYILLNNKDVKPLNTGFTIAQTISNELSTSFLPDGKYEVVYLENNSNKLLKRGHFTVNGENITFNVPADPKKFDVKKWITTTGSARLTSAFNNPQGLQSEQKNYYSRFEFNPTLVFRGRIPITASVLLTTEQNANKQPMNQLSFSFDYNYFKTLEEQRAMAKIDEMKGGKGMDDMNKLKEKYLKEKNKGYEDLKATLNSPEMKDQLAKAEEYNSLEKQCTNLEKEIDKNKMDELKKKYGVQTMADLEAKKDSIPKNDYNELKFQMTTNEAFTDSKEKMKKLEGSKANAEKLQKQKERLDKIESTDYMEMMRDPSYNKQILDKLGMNSPGSKFLGSLKSFAVGVCYPLYSELTVNGVRSKGTHIEINPGIFYAAFTKGTIRDQRYDTLLNRYEFQQKVNAGRLGIGKKNGTHFILTYVNTEEQGQSFVAPKDNVVFTPGNNLLLGAEFQLSLFKKKFVTQAEINGASTTSDNFAPAMPDLGASSEKINDLLKKMDYKPNLTTRRDYAYSVKSEMRLFKDNTIFSAYYSYIGPGYTSYTAPYLLIDQLKYEGKLRQSFWKKRISLGGFYKYVTDDLFNSKSFKTTINGYGAEAAINIPKFPSLWAKYLPVDQVSDFSVANQKGILASDLTMGGASYSYNFSKVSCNTQVMYSQYDIKDNFWGTNILMKTYLMTLSMTFKNGMNWSFNGFYNTSNDPAVKDQAGYSLTETSLIKKKLITGIEVHYLKQGTEASKTGAMLNLGIKVLKYVNTQLKVTYNSIKSTSLGDRNEIYGVLMISASW